MLGENEMCVKGTYTGAVMLPALITYTVVTTWIFKGYIEFSEIFIYLKM